MKIRVSYPRRPEQMETCQRHGPQCRINLGRWEWHSWLHMKMTHKPIHGPCSRVEDGGKDGTPTEAPTIQGIAANLASALLRSESCNVLMHTVQCTSVHPGWSVVSHQSAHVTLCTPEEGRSRPSTGDRTKTCISGIGPAKAG